MTNPHFVSTNKLTLDDGTESTSSNKTKVAFIGTFEGESEEGQRKYVDLSKNRVFYSNYAEVEIAYLSHQEILKKIKQTKLVKSQALKDDRKEKMIEIMKICIIAFFENLRQKTTTMFDVSRIPVMLLRTGFMCQEITEAYFNTGLEYGMIVNSPKKVYTECVERYVKNITSIVKGEKKLTEMEKKMLSDALSFFPN